MNKQINNSGSKYKKRHDLGAKQPVSNVYAFQVFHLKTETREAGSRHTLVLSLIVQSTIIVPLLYIHICHICISYIYIYIYFFYKYKYTYTYTHIHTYTQINTYIHIHIYTLYTNNFVSRNSHF